jgi:dihydroneopterin aldolase
MESLLAIDRARFSVRLGCHAEERTQARDVELDLRIWFRDRPPGCSTDRLEDVVCYVDLVEAVEQAIAGKEFHLIERLTVVVYEALRPLIGEDARLWVRVRKVHTPIDALKHGVSFCYGERPPQH